MPGKRNTKDKILLFFLADSKRNITAFYIVSTLLEMICVTSFVHVHGWWCIIYANTEWQTICAQCNNVCVVGREGGIKTIKQKAFRDQLLVLEALLGVLCCGRRRSCFCRISINQEGKTLIWAQICDPLLFSFDLDYVRIFFGFGIFRLFVFALCIWKPD